MLESIHLQAATLDGKYRIKQVNQQTIDLVSGPAQQIVPLTTTMAVGDRTKRAEGTRAEAQGLLEIDAYAANGKHWNEVKEEKEKTILNTMPTGSNWSKAVKMKTGQCEDNICDLCKMTNEESTHIWYCGELKGGKGWS